MQNYFDIDGVRIPFNTEWNNIAISVSGGADSALLAYLLCDLAKEHNTTIHSMMLIEFITGYSKDSITLHLKDT